MLIAPLLLATTALAGGGTFFGSITKDDPTWNRPNPTGTFPDGTCNTPAADSLNDSVHYDVYYIRGDSTADFLDITIDSLEALPIFFDPMAAVYCGVLDPNQPLVNLIDIDDDANGYPNAFIIAEANIDLDQVYTLVVSSYSNHPISQFGEYVIGLRSGLYLSTACHPDFNGDGNLNFLDISAFLALYSSQDVAADYNHDGSFNFLDVSEFLSEFGMGCP
jgi:hypothetical protein